MIRNQHQRMPKTTNLASRQRHLPLPPPDSHNILNLEAAASLALIYQDSSEPNRPACGARIIDKHGDARIAPQRGLDLGAFGLVAEIGRQYFDRPPRLVRQTSRKGPQPRLVPGHEDEVIVLLCETIGIDRTNAG